MTDHQEIEYDDKLVTMLEIIWIMRLCRNCQNDA
jgi:hypothetical protein